MCGGGGPSPGSPVAPGAPGTLITHATGGMMSLCFFFSFPKVNKSQQSLGARVPTPTPPPPTRVMKPSLIFTVILSVVALMGLFFFSPCLTPLIACHFPTKSPRSSGCSSSPIQHIWNLNPCRKQGTQRAPAPPPNLETNKWPPQLSPRHSTPSARDSISDGLNAEVSSLTC